ncbi:MAG: hypothetical protein ACREPA_03215 [Candidatus Dormibacteraceae bacterium]
MNQTLPRGRLPRASIALAALAIVLAASRPGAPPPVQAGGAYAPGGAGYDISWPQCGSPYPVLGAGEFAVVGITGGSPFAPNPCFTSEFSWASGGGVRPSVYLNVAFGKSTDGPCSPADPPCRPYDYGWNTARDAFLSAWVGTSGASLDARMWWLDVETGNTWSDDTFANSMVVRGAIDFLKTAHRRVGVYSTPSIWRTIAGGYAPADVPSWVAGATDGADYSMCFQPLWPGSTVPIFQYLPTGALFDRNHSC